MKTIGKMYDLRGTRYDLDLVTKWCSGIKSYIVNRTSYISDRYEVHLPQIANLSNIATAIMYDLRCTRYDLDLVTKWCSDTKSYLVPRTSYISYRYEVLLPQIASLVEGEKDIIANIRYDLDLVTKWCSDTKSYIVNRTSYISTYV